MSPDEPVTEPPKPPQKRRWPKIVGVTAVVIAGVLVLVAAVSAFLLNRLAGNIRSFEASTDERPQDYEPVNLLLMGSDTRGGRGNMKYGSDDGRDGERSDTTILLHISADRSRALAVSIPRDTWVRMPACASPNGAFDRFNHAFEEGGAGCTVDLVKKMTGVPIHHAVVVDFRGFKRVVDAMGGVEVCSTRPIDDKDSKLHLPAGTTIVDGETALGFVRVRKSVGDGSDIDRIKRQQAFLSSAIRQATSKQLLLNPVKLYKMLDAATGALKVDKGLDEVSEMRDFASSVRGIEPHDITFVTMPFLWRNDANIDPDRATARAIWKAIKNDTPWPPPVSVGPDGKKVTVPADQILVRVVNASSIPSKTKTVPVRLRALGFQVTDVSTARTRAVTRVLYPPGQEAAARTVAFAAGNAELVSSPSVEVITLQIGEDFAGVADRIVVAKPKGAPVANPQTTPITANEVICAD